MGAAMAAASWIAMAGVLAGCAGGPARWKGPAAGPDGAPFNPPSDLQRVPDAQPRWEPVRAGGPNKPYEVLGQTYRPMVQDAPFAERGLASWYGRRFHGQPTASGEIYDMYAMTAAHPTLPIPSYARVRNPANGREVLVRINDRGPFHPGRIIDLSYTAALKLDLLRGVAPVELERITSQDIRTGAWRRPTDPGQAVALPATSAVPAPTPVANAADPAGTAALGAVAGAALPASAPAAEPAPESAALASATPEPANLPDRAAARGWWVQLGAFRVREGAASFQRRVAVELPWLSASLAIVGDANLFRLQAGPYPGREEARAVVERVRDSLMLVPTLVERH